MGAAILGGERRKDGEAGSRKQEGCAEAAGLSASPHLQEALRAELLQPEPPRRVAPCKLHARLGPMGPGVPSCSGIVWSVPSVPWAVRVTRHWGEEGIT